MEMMTVPHSKSRISLAPSRPKISTLMVGSGMVHLPIRMSSAQKRKMMKGGAVTITRSMIDEGANDIMQLLPASAKKIMKSVLKDKGIRHSLQMGEGMMKKGGDAFTDAFDPNQNGLAQSAQKTFTPDLGRSIAKSLINDALPAVIQGATSSAVGGVTGNPIIGMLAGQTAGKYAGQRARDAINKKAGFGMKKVAIRKRIVKVGKGTRLIDQQFSVKDAGNFLTNELPSVFGGGIMKRGGSFMPAGGSIYPAGKSGGGMLGDMDMPIQLGNPYIKQNSPAMHPFIPTYSQLSGYNKIK